MQSAVMYSGTLADAWSLETEEHQKHQAIETCPRNKKKYRRETAFDEASWAE